MAATTHIAAVPPSSIFRRVNVEWSLAVMKVARRSDGAGKRVAAVRVPECFDTSIVAEYLL
jgi:hypothetical protein